LQHYQTAGRNLQYFPDKDPYYSPRNESICYDECSHKESCTHYIWQALYKNRAGVTACWLKQDFGHGPDGHVGPDLMTTRTCFKYTSDIVALGLAETDTLGLAQSCRCPKQQVCQKAGNATTTAPTPDHEDGFGKQVVVIVVTSLISLVIGITGGAAACIMRTRMHSIYVWLYTGLGLCVYGISFFYPRILDFAPASTSGSETNDDNNSHSSDTPDTAMGEAGAAQAPPLAEISTGTTSDR
jgi:hypothetical protein